MEMNNIYADNLISIKTNEKDGYLTVNVAGEMVGNAAESLIALLDNAMLVDKTLKFLLNLCKVTYISGYSFGIIALLWKKARQNNRNLFIVANAAINEKFKRLGLHDHIDLKVIRSNNVPVPEYS